MYTLTHDHCVHVSLKHSGLYFRSCYPRPFSVAGLLRATVCYSKGNRRLRIGEGEVVEATGSISAPPEWDANPSQFAGINLYSWVERGTARVKCLAQQHNTVDLSMRSPAC